MSVLKTVSDILGYTSIACWLGAQFPQVLENIRNQSTEGLALPFLASWAFGDLSNLIGCFLTNQLLFQKILASYFCFVDFTLVGQYVYYWHSKPAPVSYGHRRARASTSTIRRMSADHGAPRYRTLSAAAANVAATAALAAQQDEQANPRYHSRNRWRRSTDQLGEESGSHVVEEADEADETALAALADSFHSEGGRTARRKYVSWSRERGSTGNFPVTKSAFFSPQQTSHVEVPDPLGRGRPLQRDDGTDTEGWVRSRTTSESGNKTSSRASRKGAGMVFLGVWALFGVGNLVGSRSGLSSEGQTSAGRVLSTFAISTPDSTPTLLEIFSLDIPASTPDATPLSFQATYPKNPAIQKHHEENETLRQRVIGRIFAWLCATLYLTSRLPQIWKNFVRKSVEGLSMYMFTFAFLGNCFYVASIIFSPEFNARPPSSTAFIRESIPYLIGSGGTLVFDITIVTQSFIYKPKLNHRGRRSSVRSRLVEEETSLLRGDVLAGGSVDSFLKKAAATPWSAQPVV